MMAAEPADLSVVIPAFNEASRIEGTLDEVSRYLRDSPWRWEIRVVDDGSTDGTRDVVARAATADARIRLQTELHKGKGGAVSAGLLASNAAHRFLCDADLSMPVAELAKFMPPALGDADVVIGSREAFGARRIDEPWTRHVAGRAFNTLIRTTLLPDIQDTQCGFKMFTAAAVEAIFPHVTVTGWAFDIEVLYIARVRRLRVREVPIEWHYRADSHLRLLRDGPRMIREVLRIRARAGRGEYRQPGAE